MLFSSPKWVEKWPRSASKVVSWRLLVTGSNLAAGWFATGNFWGGLEVAGILLIVNSTLYFFHERAWNRVDWAKDANTSSESV